MATTPGRSDVSGLAADDRTPPVASILRPGTVIVERFRLQERIGVGGMGAVYRTRDLLLGRDVAIKVLLDDSVAGQQRLLREAMAMAQLSHPNVVTAYDAGTYEHGVFIAMELVNGETLAAWLARPGRSWREVRDVFLAAGEGLRAMHDAGLVHRDFKPSNVLIDGAGRVRVADLGLVRAADNVEPGADDVHVEVREGLHTTLTMDNGLIGTPAYMAPEQRERRKVDARADQFAFCVALAEAWPPGTPARLRAVSARGLEIDPERRYPEMARLLAELSDDPVARRRRRLALAAFGGTLLVGGAAVTRLVAPPAEPCLGAAKKLAGIWDDGQRARVAAAFRASGNLAAETSLRRVTAILDEYAAAWVDMSTDACAATRVRGEQSDEHLGLRMLCLDDRLAGLGALAGIYARADHELVERSVEGALALDPIAGCADVKRLASRVPPPVDAAAARRVAELGARLAQAKALGTLDRPEEALGLAEPLLAEVRAAAHCPLEADTLLAIGDLEDAARRSKDAEPILYQALWRAEACRYDEGAARAWIALLSTVGQSLGRHAESERLAEHARAAIVRVGGSDDLESQRLHELSRIADDQGRRDEALELQRRSLGLAERSLGPAHAVVGRRLANLALPLAKLGRFREAEDASRRALGILAARLGPEHPTVGKVHHTLGIILRNQGRLDEALVEERLALAIFDAVAPLGVEAALASINLGSILNGSGAYAASEIAYRRAIVGLSATLGPDHPNVASAQIGLGGSLTQLGRFAETETLLRAIVARFEHATGPARETLGIALLNLGIGLLDEGRLRDALAAAQRSVAVFEEALGREHPKLVNPLVLAAMVEERAGKATAALALAARALAIAEEAQTPPLEAQLVVGRALLALGRSGEAVATLEKVHTGDPKRADVSFALARALVASGGDRKRADALAEEARAGFVAGGAPARRSLAELDAWRAAAR